MEKVGPAQRASDPRAHSERLEVAAWNSTPGPQQLLIKGLLNTYAATDPEATCWVQGTGSHH